MMKILNITVLAFVLSACGTNNNSPQNTSQTSPSVAVTDSAAAGSAGSGSSATQFSGETDTAIFAGGCFWCVESDFEKLGGVIEAVSGYTGGHLDNPNYKDVTYKETGHYEAVKVTYDPQAISYEKLVEYFWKTIDPTDDRGQFCDKGSSYRTAIFVRPDQIEVASVSKARLEENKPFAAPIVTPVLPASRFYDAEGYHQDYYKKNPVRYNYYRKGCGRDKRLKQLWGE